MSSSARRLAEGIKTRTSVSGRRRVLASRWRIDRPSWRQDATARTGRRTPAVLASQEYIRENDHEFQRLPNLRIQPCVQAPVSRRARSCRCCNPADSARRARSGRGEIDRYPSSLLSAALSQATDGVGERAQDPTLSWRTGLDSGQGGRTNG